MTRALVTLLLSFTSNSIAQQNYPVLPDQTVKGIFAERPHVPDDQVIQLLTESKESDCKSDLVKLVVWNIYKGKMEGVSNDLLNFVNASDVVMIQEWIQTPDLINLAKSFNNANTTLAAGFWNRDNFMTGVMTASKANPTHTEWVRSEFVEPFIKTPKMVLMTEYFFPNLEKHVLFVNIHGLNRTTTKKFIRQMEQTEARIKNYRGSVIFGGDFNTRNEERTEYLKKWSRRNGFQVVTFANDNREKILDYIITKGVNVKNSHLYTDVQSSDHTAMAIEFN